MPRLPDIDDFGSRPIPQSRERFDPTARPGADIAAGLNNLASAGYQITERQDRLTYAKTKSDLLMEDLKTRAELENDPDWETYEPRYRERMKKARETALGQIRSKTDRIAFEQDSDFDIERGALAVRGLAKSKEVDTGRATLENVLTTNRNAALEAKDSGTRTALIQSASDALRGAKAKGYISAQEEEGHWQKWTADYGEGFLDVQTLPKRIEILSKPKGTPADFIAPDRRAVLLKAAKNELESEQRARLTELRQSLTDQMQDISAAAQAGIPVTNVPGRASFVAAFGDREGAQRYESATKLANLSIEVSSLHGQPNADLVKEVEKYRPKQVEGAAEQGQLHNFMARSVSQILTQREKDPAGYLMQNSPTVQRAWAEFSQDPARAPAYLSAVTAEKERLGIASNDVLPDAYVQGLADEIAGEKTAEGLAARIESETQRWGDAWPDVYGQLAGKLPDTAMVIGSGIPQRAATSLAATMKLKDTELKAMLPPDVKWNDVEASVDSQFADFQRSMPPEAARTWNAVRDSAVRLSVKYMNDGDGQSDAVKKAYADLVESQYSLIEFRNSTFRVPNTLDADAIETGARFAIGAYAPDAASLAVPAGAAQPVEEYASQWGEYVRENGYWVTRPDGKGLRLYADGGPILDASGPFELTWEQLQKSAADANAERVKRQREEAAKRMERR